MDTAEMISAVSLIPYTAVTKIGDFIIDFRREFEAIFKKALSRVSGA
jgi:hypothetical protein